ncbi:hypothetical protein [Sphingobacterium thalpophilum]|uniref:Lipid A core - O-antigen ligase and related enzymes n=1 Tax=Sphingobacterium thalpophilum TaxID=259 RepID=A0A4U9UPX0_9SPHI|nr:hypothetical protein [Sphingobacterium thalpophilum]VTR34917.1 Uncharacterised protein [Sphingobacterium thalpophilum]
MKISKLTSIYFFVLLVAALGSMYFRYFWDIRPYLSILAALVSVIYCNILPNSFNRIKNCNVLPVLLFLVLRCYLSIDENVNGIIFCFSEIIIVTFFILLKDDLKSQFLDYFAKKFAIILGISLFGWFLFLLRVSLPHDILIYGDKGAYQYENYYVFLKIFNQYSLEVFPRFQGLFLEPGHLGLCLPFFLYIYKFDFKNNKFLYIFLISIILSFSLAAYVLVFLAFFFIKISNIKSFVNLLLLGSIGLVVILSVGSGDDNVFNRLILSRLEVEDGTVAGDNRTNQIFDRNFDEFSKSSKLFAGVGSVEYTSYEWKKGAAGYKVFIFKYGLIGLVLLASFYISVWRKNRLNYYSTVLFLLFVLNFYQREYAYWLISILIFISAISNFKIYVEHGKHN